MVRSLEEALKEFEAKIRARDARKNQPMNSALRYLFEKGEDNARSAITHAADRAQGVENCAAYRSNDQWLCACGMSCDTHDEAPPMCPTTGLQIGLKRVG